MTFAVFVNRSNDVSLKYHSLKMVRSNNLMSLAQVSQTRLIPHGGRFAFLRNCPLSWLGEILLFSTVSTERQMPGVCYHKIWTIADLMTLPKINSKVRVPVIQGWRNDSRGSGGGTRTWGPSRKRVPKCLKGPKTTYKNIAIAEKQSKRIICRHVDNCMRNNINAFIAQTGFVNYFISVQIQMKNENKM